MFFEKMQNRKNDGFTLVELIVVIAILAILAGIGVPAYSGYVEKATMAADQQLVSEVANALTLYYYDNYETPASGQVILTASGVTPSGVGDAAMQAVFGAEYASDASIALKYDGWKSGGASASTSQQYQASSYNGKEESLLNEVGKLTNVLSGAISANPTLVGTSFNDYLTNTLNLENADSQTKANAAVLYAADTVSKADAKVIQGAFDTYYKELQRSDPSALGNLTATLKNELGTFGACAAIYAHAEAYCQYSQENGSTQNLLTSFHNNTLNIESADQALTQVGNAFQTVINGALSETDISAKYLNDKQYTNDITGYIASMNAIKNNQNLLADRLGQTDCYTDGTAANMLTGYINAGNAGVADGQVGIFLDTSGNVSIWPQMQ